MGPSGLEAFRQRALLGGLAGESNRQNAVGVNDSAGDQVGDALGNRVGFAGTGPGHDDQRQVVLLNRLQLFMVELPAD